MASEDWLPFCMDLQKDPRALDEIPKLSFAVALAVQSAVHRNWGEISSWVKVADDHAIRSRH
jgi:hypothetical protein